MKTRQIRLLERPDGLPKPRQFALSEVDLPVLRGGQVLVENLYMSVDPYMRRSMDAVAKDLPPWPIGGPLDGPSIGRVIESRNTGYVSGDLVESMSGWQQRRRWGVLLALERVRAPGRAHRNANAATATDVHCRVPAQVH